MNKEAGKGKWVAPEGGWMWMPSSAVSSKVMQTMLKQAHAVQATPGSISSRVEEDVVGSPNCHRRES